VVEVGLLLRFIRAGLPDTTPPAPAADDADEADTPLAFAY
jgi:hypothetical protein